MRDIYKDIAGNASRLGVEVDGVVTIDRATFNKMVDALMSCRRAIFTEAAKWHEQSQSNLLAQAQKAIGADTRSKTRVVDLSLRAAEHGMAAGFMRSKAEEP